MRCPNCAAESADGSAECPSCGLLFAKWREKQERSKREAAAALAALSVPGAAPVKEESRWTRRGAAVVVTAVWLGALTWYLNRHIGRVQRQRAASELIGETILVRDPVTGDMRKLRIESARSSSSLRKSPPSSSDEADSRESGWIEAVPRPER